MSCTTSMAIARARSVPGGACPARTSAINARCQECSAEFSCLDPSLIRLCLATVFSRSASSTNRICRSSDSSAPMLPAWRRPRQAVWHRASARLATPNATPLTRHVIMIVGDPNDESGDRLHHAHPGGHLPARVGLPPACRNAALWVGAGHLTRTDARQAAAGDSTSPRLPLLPLPSMGAVSRAFSQRELLRSVAGLGDGRVHLVVAGGQLGLVLAPVHVLGDPLVVGHERFQVGVRRIEYAQVGVGLLHFGPPQPDVLDTRHDPAEQQRAERLLDRGVLGELHALRHVEAHLLPHLLRPEPVAHEVAALYHELLALGTLASGQLAVVVAQREPP